MARLPLPLGSWGLIRTTRDTRGAGATTRFRAIATFRDFDGTTRQVEAAGRSKTAAEQNLRRVLQSKQAEGRRGDLTGLTRFRDAADVWLEGLDDLVEQGRRSPGTVATYRRQLRNHVLPALGEMRLGRAPLRRWTGSWPGSGARCRERAPSRAGR